MKSVWRLWKVVVVVVHTFIRGDLMNAIVVTRLAGDSISQAEIFDHVPASFGLAEDGSYQDLSSAELRLADPLVGCPVQHGKSTYDHPLCSPSEEFVFLISRGQCNFTEKVLWAQTWCANGAIVYDDMTRGQENWGVIMTAEGTAMEEMSSSILRIPSVFVSFETGMALVSALKNAHPRDDCGSTCRERSEPGGLGAPLCQGDAKDGDDDREVDAAAEPSGPCQEPPRSLSVAETSRVLVAIDSTGSVPHLDQPIVDTTFLLQELALIVTAALSLFALMTGWLALWSVGAGVLERRVRMVAIRKLETRVFGNHAPWTHGDDPHLTSTATAATAATSATTITASAVPLPLGPKSGGASTPFSPEDPQPGGGGGDGRGSLGEMMVASRSTSAPQAAHSVSGHSEGSTAAAATTAAAAVEAPGTASDAASTPTPSQRGHERSAGTRSFSAEREKARRGGADGGGGKGGGGGRAGESLIGEQTSCAVCLEDYTIGDRLKVLPCFHCFHEACIVPWLHHRSVECPLCKQVVQSVLRSQRSPSLMWIPGFGNTGETDDNDDDESSHHRSQHDNDDSSNAGSGSAGIPFSNADTPAQ